MIAIVNYGMGNLDSVLRAFRKCEAEAAVSSQPEEIKAAGAIVLPGVGSFAKAMQNLNERGLLAPLNQMVLEGKTPILGICLGFQLFTKHSEEGDVDGLGWVDGQTRRLDFEELDVKPKIPHIGWNDLEFRKESLLFKGIHPDACFYFAHSYCVSCNDRSAVLGTTTYGYEFVSVIEQGNIFGMQFHPEKSHANGLRLLRNFIEYTRHA